MQEHPGSEGIGIPMIQNEDTDIVPQTTYPERPESVWAEGHEQRIVAETSGELFSALMEWLDAEVDRMLAWDAYQASRPSVEGDLHYIHASDASIRKGTAERRFQRAFAQVASERAAQRRAAEREGQS